MPCVKQRGRFHGSEEVSGGKSVVLMPVCACPVELICSTLCGHVDLSGPGELGRVIPYDYVDFFHDVNIGRLQRAAVARNSVHRRLCLGIRDAGHLNP